MLVGGNAADHGSDFGGREDDGQFELGGGAGKLQFGGPGALEGLLPEELDRTQRLSGALAGETALGLEIDEILAELLGTDPLGGAVKVLGQLAHAGPVALLAAGQQRQQGQILGEAVQDCVGGTFSICITRYLQVDVDGLPGFVPGEPSTACGRLGQRPMQNQTTSLPSAKPQRPRLHRRVAASFNSANQRTSRTEADSSYWAYQYDSLGQVTSGRKYWPDNSPAAGQQFTYRFDDIGNRQTTAAGGDSAGQHLRPATYLANSLNQYVQRTVPGYVSSLGSANSNATVSLWAEDDPHAAAARKGEYFNSELPVNNTADALWLTLTNLAVLANGSSADIVTSTIGHEFVAQSPEQFTYNADGNLIQDGRWNYTWDAENRLVKLTPSTSVGPQISLQFDYDSHGRRIRQRVWDNANWSGSPTNDLRFVYDGWNLIAELNTSTLVRSYVWGIDLSGTMQGAGGVGGLLAVSDISNAYFPAFDGNGNVAALVNASDGTASAQYEFGPFGEVIRATGPMAKANPFRFSTKYQDDETDLVYYGVRYLKTSTGGWLSRDPIGEKGGRNLYGFVGNNPIGKIDYLGKQGVISGTKCWWRCGPDITDGLKATKKQVEADFHALEASDPEKAKANCEPFAEWLNSPDKYVWAMSAWDMDMVWDENGPYAHTGEFLGGCPFGQGCKGSVTVSGTCHWKWNVNYLLYGWINKLCGIDKGHMRNTIRAWKATKPKDWGEIGNAVAFAEAGYDGFPDSGSIPSDSTYTKAGCQPCTAKYGSSGLGSSWPDRDNPGRDPRRRRDPRGW